MTNAEPAADALAAHCRGVTKSFRSAAGVVQALRGIDLDVPRGSVTMLVGPSGCGKTTLISIIAGILASDAGLCRILGTVVAGLPVRQQLDFRARHIGFIFQHFHLLPSLTLAENVAIPLIINGEPRHGAREAAIRLLAAVELADRANDSPKALSGGEQQRVAIARALVHRPDLVVCDEPTSALDHHTGMKVIELMRRMVQERGTTILIVTHDNRIFPFADLIARMDDGRIVNVTSSAASVDGRQGLDTIPYQDVTR